MIAMYPSWAICDPSRTAVTCFLGDGDDIIILFSSLDLTSRNDGVRGDGPMLGGALWAPADLIPVDPIERWLS